jgi:hypothetical protein
MVQRLIAPFKLSNNCNHKEGQYKRQQHFQPQGLDELS